MQPPIYAGSDSPLRLPSRRKLACLESPEEVTAVLMILRCSPKKQILRPPEGAADSERQVAAAF